MRSREQLIAVLASVNGRGLGDQAFAESGGGKFFVATTCHVLAAILKQGCIKPRSIEVIYASWFLNGKLKFTDGELSPHIREILAEAITLLKEDYPK